MKNSAQNTAVEGGDVRWRTLSERSRNSHLCFSPRLQRVSQTQPRKKSNKNHRHSRHNLQSDRIAHITGIHPCKETPSSNQTPPNPQPIIQTGVQHGKIRPRRSTVHTAHALDDQATAAAIRAAQHGGDSRNRTRLRRGDLTITAHILQQRRLLLPRRPGLQPHHTESPTRAASNRPRNR